MSNSVATIDTTTSAGEATAETDVSSETRIPSVTSQSSASMLRELVTAMQAKDSRNRNNGEIDAKLEEALSKLNMMSDEINLIFEDTDNSESRSGSSALSGSSSLPSGGRERLKSSPLTSWIEKTLNTKNARSNHVEFNSRDSGDVRSTVSTVTPTVDSPPSCDIAVYNRKSQQYDPELAAVRESSSNTIEDGDDQSITLSSSGRVARNNKDRDCTKLNAERTERLEKKIQQIHKEEEESSSSIRFEIEKTISDGSFPELTVAGVLRDIMVSSSDEEDSETGSEGSSSFDSSGDEHESAHDSVPVDEESIGNIAVGTASLSSMDNTSIGSDYNRKYGHGVVLDNLPSDSCANEPPQHEADEECEPYGHPQPPPRMQLYPLHQIPENDASIQAGISNSQFEQGPPQEGENMEDSRSEMDEMMAWYKAKEEMQDKSDAYFPGLRMSSNSTTSSSISPGSHVNSNSSSISPGSRVNSNSSSTSPGTRVDSDLSFASGASRINSGSSMCPICPGSRVNSNASSCSSFSVSPPQRPLSTELPSNTGDVTQNQTQVISVLKSKVKESVQSADSTDSADSSRASSPNPDSVGWEELGLSEREREALHRYENEKQSKAVHSTATASGVLDSADMELLLLQQEMMAMHEKQFSKRSVGSSDNGSVDWAEVGLSREERQQMQSLDGDFLRQQVAEFTMYEMQRDRTPSKTRAQGSLSDSIALELSKYESRELEKMQLNGAPEDDSSGSSEDSSNDSNSTLEAEPQDETRAPSTEKMLKEKRSRSGKLWDLNLPGAYDSSNDPDDKATSVKDGTKSKKHKVGKATYHRAGHEESSKKALVSTGAQAIASTSSLFPKAKGQVSTLKNEECYVDLLHEETFEDEPIPSGDVLPLHKRKKALNRRKLVICCVCGWIVAIVAFAFMMGVLLSSSLQGDSNSGTGSSGEQSLAEFISRVSPKSAAEFEDPGSYQSKALAWLKDNINLSLYSDTQKIQRWILACLFFSTSDIESSDNWISSDKWLSDLEECTWKGVVCDGIGRSVVAIELPNNRLRGELPYEVSLLSSTLVTLDLHNNFLTNAGDEGHDLFQELTNLRRLNIGSNDFVYDGIPIQFGKLTNLHVLDISNMAYSGELRGKVFSKLLVLKDLRMGGNDFSSSIPIEIGNLQSLEYLHVEESGITGDLSFTEPMNRIYELWLGRNPRLKGTIPATLGDTPTLASISVSECGLKGTIPTELGRLTNLESLWLADNGLTGTVPTEIGNIPKLRRLEITGNALTGTMPAELCVMTQPPGLLALLEADCVDEVLCDCCTRCY